MRLLVALACVLCLAGAGSAAALRHEARGLPRCASVALSTGAGGNGMTGGTIAYWVSLTNTGRVTCEVDGRPWVRVPTSRYAVTVDDLRIGEYGGGFGRLVKLAPGRTARAHVLMMRGRCDFRKSDSATLIVRVGWATRSVATGGEACLHEGATVAVGPFEP
jgi:hypothetical protein